eukprot:COSAG03_NODE_3167_length_2166_cov_6.094248_2_plen_89_part_00
MFPACYIRSNRELFEEQHNLPGGCFEDCVIGCCCWGCGLRQVSLPVSLSLSLMHARLCVLTCLPACFSVYLPLCLSAFSLSLSAPLCG